MYLISLTKSSNVLPVIRDSRVDRHLFMVPVSCLDFVLIGARVVFPEIHHHQDVISCQVLHTFHGRKLVSLPVCTEKMAGQEDQLLLQEIYQD